MINKLINLLSFPLERGPCMRVGQSEMVPFDNACEWLQFSKTLFQTEMGLVDECRIGLKL